MLFPLYTNVVFELFEADIILKLKMKPSYYIFKFLLILNLDCDGIIMYIYYIAT